MSDSLFSDIPLMGRSHSRVELLSITKATPRTRVHSHCYHVVSCQVKLPAGMTFGRGRDKKLISRLCGVDGMSIILSSDFPYARQNFSIALLARNELHYIDIVGDTQGLRSEDVRSDVGG